MPVLLALSLFAMLITIHDDDPDGGSGDNSNGEVNVGGVVVFSSSSARQKIPRRSCLTAWRRSYDDAFRVSRTIQQDVMEYSLKERERDRKRE
ncbi:hypothetical protein M0804_001865 [Polistes exclamans]|nr:hypothetical protein M0804_001865 [Polistes exclamans]